MPDAAPPNLQQNALLSLLMRGQSGGLDLPSLLAAQAGGGDQASGLDLPSLLAAQAGGGESGAAGEDRMNMALRWIEQQRAAAPSAPVEETPSAAEIELDRLEEMRHQREQHEQARELENLMKTMYAELETLRTRNDTLAAALGACHLCFGEDPICPECGGRGGSGALLPDAAAFRQYVAPALNRVRATQTRYRAVSVPRTGPVYQSPGQEPVPNTQQPAATR